MALAGATKKESEMSDDRVPQKRQLVNGKWWTPPPGCLDPELAFKIANNAARMRLGPRRKSTPSRASGRTTKAKQNMAISKALLSSLERHQEKHLAELDALDEIPFRGEPSMQIEDVTRNWPDDWLEDNNEPI
jgi:hypothetical protein